MELTQERLNELVNIREKAQQAAYEIAISSAERKGQTDEEAIMAADRIAGRASIIAIIEEATGEKVTIVERIIPVRDFLENQDSTSEEEILQALHAQRVCLYDIWDSDPHDVNASCCCSDCGNYENTLQRLAKSTARRNIAANPGFHWKDDWFFKRLKGGEVQILHRNKGDYFDVRLVIPVPEWASIVCSVSNAGETTPRWEQAQEFHDRVETQSEKGVEPEPEIPEAAIEAVAELLWLRVYRGPFADAAAGVRRTYLSCARKHLIAAYKAGWGGLRK